MESMGLNQQFWRGKRVFITGHTGFKGSWLCLLLQKLGAVIGGYSLPIEMGVQSHFVDLKIKGEFFYHDIRNCDQLKLCLNQFKPDIVIHLAAQPLVQAGYSHPHLTYEINVMGTLNLLESVRYCESVRAVLVITTDKVYENREWLYPYREEDTLGGYDPYSSSKACVEFLTSSYRQSYFPLSHYGVSHQVLISTARAGNVIGGGDWSESRLIPDMIKAWQDNQTLLCRSPLSVRPWQHVLEPLVGYCLLAEKLVQGDSSFAKAWNFGPDSGAMCTVEQILSWCKDAIPALTYQVSPKDFHEAGLLSVDSSLAKHNLGYQPVWSAKQAVIHSIQWYQNYYDQGQVITEKQIDAYFADLAKKGKE
jgi:CDP-glucose 4,6-dehydratase